MVTQAGASRRPAAASRSDPRAEVARLEAAFVASPCADSASLRPLLSLLHSASAEASAVVSATHALRRAIHTLHSADADVGAASSGGESKSKNKNKSAGGDVRAGTPLAALCDDFARGLLAILHPRRAPALHDAAVATAALVAHRVFAHVVRAALAAPPDAFPDGARARLCAAVRRYPDLQTVALEAVRDAAAPAKAAAATAAADVMASSTTAMSVRGDPNGEDGEDDHGDVEDDEDEDEDEDGGSDDESDASDRDGEEAQNEQKEIDAEEPVKLLPLTGRFHAPIAARVELLRACDAPATSAAPACALGGAAQKAARRRDSRARTAAWLSVLRDAALPRPLLIERLTALPTAALSRVSDPLAFADALTACYDLKDSHGGDDGDETATTSVPGQKKRKKNKKKEEGESGSKSSGIGSSGSSSGSTRSDNATGVAVAALDGLFVLISKHGLDYPRFYHKLYALLTPATLGAGPARSARFLELAALFLRRGALLPGRLVAAFVKRLARRAVQLPPADALWCLRLALDLLYAHPAVHFLVHRPTEGGAGVLLANSNAAAAAGAEAAGTEEAEEEGEGAGKQAEDDDNDRKKRKREKKTKKKRKGGADEEEEERAGKKRKRREAGADPFDDREEDPELSGASESSLWELEILEKHVSPAISRLVSAFSNDVRRNPRPVPGRLEDYASLTFEDMFETEMKRKAKANHVAYEAPGTAAAVVALRKRLGAAISWD